MATRTSSPYTWSPGWGQGEEGPWAGEGPSRDIRGMAPCQALRAEEAKNRKAHSPERARVCCSGQQTQGSAGLNSPPILAQEGSARSEVQPTLLPGLRILGFRSPAVWSWHPASSPLWASVSLLVKWGCWTWQGLPAPPL